MNRISAPISHLHQLVHRLRGRLRRAHQRRLRQALDRRAAWVVQARTTPTLAGWAPDGHC